MTLHYHGTPITPIAALYELGGRLFCVSHAAPQDVRRCHEIGQSVMLDCGSYTAWKVGRPTDWPSYYAWCDRWLDYPSSWAVPPDVIDGPTEEQDRLLLAWPHGRRQAGPVWHMNEPIGRLCRLVDEGWARVCIGSTAEFAVVLSDTWRQRMDLIWNTLIGAFGRPPLTHMLRGMQCVRMGWPFGSVDSSDIAQNHHRPQNTTHQMADRWDAVQCPGGWLPRPLQIELI